MLDFYFIDNNFKKTNKIVNLRLQMLTIERTIKKKFLLTFTEQKKKI